MNQPDPLRYAKKLLGKRQRQEEEGGAISNMCKDRKKKDAPLGVFAMLLARRNTEVLSLGFLSDKQIYTRIWKQHMNFEEVVAHGCSAIIIHDLLKETSIYYILQ